MNLRVSSIPMMRYPSRYNPPKYYKSETKKVQSSDPSGISFGETLQNFINLQNSKE